MLEATKDTGATAFTFALPSPLGLCDACELLLSAATITSEGAVATVLGGTEGVDTTDPEFSFEAVATSTLALAFVMVLVADLARDFAAGLGLTLPLLLAEPSIMGRVIVLLTTAVLPTDTAGEGAIVMGFEKEATAPAEVVATTAWFTFACCITADTAVTLETVFSVIPFFAPVFGDAKGILTEVVVAVKGILAGSMVAVALATGTTAVVHVTKVASLELDTARPTDAKGTLVVVVDVALLTGSIPIRPPPVLKNLELLTILAKLGKGPLSLPRLIGTFCTGLLFAELGIGGGIASKGDAGLCGTTGCCSVALDLEVFRLRALPVPRVSK